VLVRAASTDRTLITSTIVATTLIAAANTAVGGLFQVNAYGICTTAGSVGSTMDVKITYVDENAANLGTTARTFLLLTVPLDVMALTTPPTNISYVLRVAVAPIGTVNMTGAAGGSGYTVGDVLTLGTGTGGTVTVATLSGSAVATVTLTKRGVNYTTGVKTTTGGTGTGCTVNVATIGVAIQYSIPTFTNTGGSPTASLFIRVNAV
jgi:hypothetical protein